MLNFLRFFILKTDIKLTLHHMGKIFIIELIDTIFNLEGYIFKKFFTIKKNLGWTYGFHARADLPRAH